MNVAELLESRQKDWLELEQHVDRLKSMLGRMRMKSDDMARFSSLYRSVCADLALAEAYRFPPGVVRQLNDLVGRAHNQLYTDQSIGWRTLPRYLLHDLPKNIFSDGFFWLGMGLFFGPMMICGLLAYYVPDFAADVVGQNALENIEQMHAESVGNKAPEGRAFMYGFYFWHNAGIGLQVFAMGAFFAIGGIFITIFNAIFLGTIFGHMATVPQATHFFEFVTAHGPFELTAIALASGAGLRIGFAMVMPNGMDRMDAVSLAARRTGPFALLAVGFFGCAAFIEAFISPSSMESLKTVGISSLAFKQAIAILTAGFLFTYIVFLGGTAWLRDSKK